MKSLLSSFISKKKNDKAEELFEDIKEESKFFEEFLRLHEKKIKLVKIIIPLWKKGKIRAIKMEIKEIREINKKLLDLLDKILEIAQKERDLVGRALFRFIIKEKMNFLIVREKMKPELAFRRLKAISNRDNYKKYVSTLKIEPYFKQLFDHLRSLSEAILLQNKYLRKGSAVGTIAKDLTEKRFFYERLIEEAMYDRKIKQNLIEIVRAINEELGYEKGHGLQFRTVTDQGRTKLVIRKGVFLEEIMNVNSINFESFYRLYERSYPSDEIQDKEELQEFLEYMGAKLSIKEGDNRAHLVVGFLGNEVIAFSLFSTTYIKKLGICYGHGWWTTVDIKYRGFGVLEKVYMLREQIMQRDVEQYKARQLSHIFIDVNDPKKMNNRELQSHVKAYWTDPWITLNFFEKMGFMPMKHKHITPALTEREPIRYETLLIKPFIEDWKRLGGVPLDVYLLIYWYDIRYGYDRIPEKDPVYKEVREDIIKSAVEKTFKGRKIKVVPFGWN